MAEQSKRIGRRTVMESEILETSHMFLSHWITLIALKEKFFRQVVIHLITAVTSNSIRVGENLFIISTDSIDHITLM